MNHKRTILIVEDETSICNFMTTILHSNDYHTLVAGTASQAKSMIASYGPDLILLDLGLPDMDGLDFLASIRQWCRTPIIVVSARTHEAEKVHALDLGADDYITKPFGISELTARIRTALRHADQMVTASGTPAATVYTVGDLTVDLDKRLITLAGKEVHFTQIEFKILVLLIQHAGKVLTYDYILRQIWGPYAVNDNQILRVNMANIRRKLEQNPASPKYIQTELGVGYRMMESPQ